MKVQSNCDQCFKRVKTRLKLLIKNETNDYWLSCFSIYFFFFLMLSKIIFDVLSFRQPTHSNNINWSQKIMIINWYTIESLILILFLSSLYQEIHVLSQLSSLSFLSYHKEDKEKGKWSFVKKKIIPSLSLSFSLTRFSSKIIVIRKTIKEETN